MLDLWKEKSAVPTHALHFSFGIGALIAPQVARPFLPQLHDSRSDMDHVANTTVIPELLNSTQTGQGDQYKDRIEIVYGILGGITLLFSLVFLLFQLKRKGLTNEVEKNISMKTSCIKFLSNIKEEFRFSLIFLFALLMLAFALPVGAERAYGKFLFSFSVESSLKMAPKTATSLESVFWASFTAGRGIATLVSKWTPPHILLACEIVIKIISAFLLAFLADTYPEILWVMSGFLGATISPIFPACIVWVNLHIKMTAWMNAFAFISTAMGAFAFSWIAGYLFEYKGPMYLMYLMLCYSLVTAVVYTLLYLFFRFVGIPKNNKVMNDGKVDGVKNELNQM